MEQQREHNKGRQHDLGHSWPPLGNPSAIGSMVAQNRLMIHYSQIELVGVCRDRDYNIEDKNELLKSKQALDIFETLVKSPRLFNAQCYS